MDFSLPEEVSAFRDMVHRWVNAEAPKDWARELERKEDEYPFELWDKFSEAGFHGIGIDEKYGGQGGDVLIQMVLARELARTLGGLAWIWGITSFVGSKSLSLYGTEDQKQRFLPQIAAGKLRASIGFTEPGGGTDVLGALQTNAVRGDGGWILNGEKIWCSSAHVADYIMVLARTNKHVEKQHHGVSLFFVPAKQDNIKIKTLPKLGMRSIGSCSVVFNDVFIPDDLVMGEPDNAWRALLPTLNNERIMVGAFCLGVIDGVLEDAVDYMKQRRAFGKLIGEFQSLQHYVADIATSQKKVELMLHYTAFLQSKGIDCGMESSMLKVTAADAAVEAADHGIQIMGGMGYSTETDMQRYWRDARLWKIGPITQEVARNGIAERLGLPRSY